MDEVDGEMWWMTLEPNYITYSPCCPGQWQPFLGLFFFLFFVDPFSAFVILTLSLASALDLLCVLLSGSVSIRPYTTSSLLLFCFFVLRTLYLSDLLKAKT